MKLLKQAKHFKLNPELVKFIEEYGKTSRRTSTGVVELALERLAKAEGYDLEKLRESVLE
jgi:hypothetical protein